MGVDDHSLRVLEPIEHSEWECRPLGMKDVVWRPMKSSPVPNAFQRWMLRVFFATVWTKRNA